MVPEMHKEKWPKKWPNKTGKEIPVQVLQKINRPEVGLFFCAKFQSERIWIPPTLNFQLNFSILFFLEILFRFDSNFKNIARHFESPRGTDFSLKIPF